MEVAEQFNRDVAAFMQRVHPSDPVHSASNLLIGIILLNLTAGILLLLPFLGWVLTRNHLADIVSELKRHLDLQQVE